VRVLVACEFSGIVRDEFRALGHDAWSCDLEPSLRPGPHLRTDVLNVLDLGWDMMIAHPPCTFLCNSGVRWLKTDHSRWFKMDQAATFFKTLLDATIIKICIENPIPHKYALLPPYTQLVQPWQFGHGETKATCLWLKDLPKLKPTRVVTGRAGRIHNMSPGPNRGRERSITYRGIARAMANQWG
jgi:hypothetical protein